MSFNNQLDKKPERIISLVPSQTELLYDLGLEEYVTGITKFCIHPAHWKKTKTIIGGTKNLRIDEIRRLNPDLIIANQEENVKSQVEMLAKDFPVYVSDIKNLEDALQMIRQTGKLTHTEVKSSELCALIEDAFRKLDHEQFTTIPVAYLIWKDPYMTIGSDTFIHDMLQRAGFENVFSHLTRYPEIDIEMLRASAASHIMLSSEPYPFKSKHEAYMKDLLPGKTVVLADGEMFSWYGSRLLKAAGYLKTLRASLQPKT